MIFQHARTGAPRMSFISSPGVPPVQAMEDATALQGWTARQTTTRPTTARAEARAVKLVRKVACAKTISLPQSLLEAFGPQCRRISLARPLSLSCGESMPAPWVSPWCDRCSIQQATNARSVRRKLTTSKEASGRATTLHVQVSA